MKRNRHASDALAAAYTFAMLLATWLLANGTVLTNNGEEWVSERIAGVQGAGTNNVAANAGSHIGIGTGTTTPAKGDTALVTEVETRVATSVTTTGTGSANKYQATGTVAITATRAVSEVGLFSASSGGVMFVRCVHDVLNVVNGDSIAYTITIDPS